MLEIRSKYKNNRSGYFKLFTFGELKFSWQFQKKMIIRKICFCSQLLFVVILSNFRISSAHSTKSCSDSDPNCLSYPAKCQVPECLLIYRWNLTQSGLSHRFSLTAKIAPELQLNSAWVAIGFSTDQFMVLIFKTDILGSK